MKDIMIRATAADHQIRVFLARTTQTVEEGRTRHGLFPTSADALGRLLTAAALMGMTLKHPEDTVTLRVMGDGPLGAIVAVGNNQAQVKGYVQNPHVYMSVKEHGKYAFANAVGMGVLYVTKDMGLKEPYTGSVPLVSGEIAADLSEYFMSSEQTPSAFGLGVIVEKDGSIGSAGGFLIQLLPGTDDAVAARLEEKLETLGGVSGLLADNPSSEEMLDRLLGGFSPVILEEQPVKYHCGCHRERLEGIMRSLGTEELGEIIRTQKEAEVSCHFCGNVYRFSEDELQLMIEDLEKGERH